MPVRRWVGRLGARVRDVLDLPSRVELDEALVRLDDLQHRLDVLADTQLRDLGDQVAGLEDKQEAGDQAVRELAAEQEKVRAIGRDLEQELKSTAKTLKKSKKEKKAKKAKDKRKPEINVGSPKSMKERKQAKDKAKAKAKAKAKSKARD